MEDLWDLRHHRRQHTLGFVGVYSYYVPVMGVAWHWLERRFVMDSVVLHVETIVGTLNNARKELHHSSQKSC